MNQVNKIPICPYCEKTAKLVTGKGIYHSPEYAHLLFWNCDNCKAYVGCHPKTKRPLGTLANKELRQHRIEVHRKFDPLWKGEGTKKRSLVYRWLAFEMRIPDKECHVGMFDLKRCKEALSILTQFEKSKMPKPKEVDFPEAFSEGMSFFRTIRSNDLPKYISAAKKSGMPMEYWKSGPNDIEIWTNPSADHEEFRGYVD